MIFTIDVLALFGLLLVLCSPLIMSAPGGMTTYWLVAIFSLLPAQVLACVGIRKASFVARSNRRRVMMMVLFLVALLCLVYEYIIGSAQHRERLNMIDAADRHAGMMHESVDWNGDG